MKYFVALYFLSMKILMVCLGNICRSPIAEGVLRKKTEEHGLDWEVDSAGTGSYHIGSAPHRHSQEICRKNGIDITYQRARQFEQADFNKYDKIYAFDGDVYEEILYKATGRDTSNVVLFLNELNPGNDESVPDPYYGGADGYIFVYDIIDKTCDAIINKYK